MRTNALEVYKILEKIAGEAHAKTLVEYFERADTTEIDKAVNSKIDHLATKEELASGLGSVRSDLLKAIYIVGIVQFLAIVGAVLAIISFMLK